VPNGPWAHHGENNTVAQLLRRGASVASADNRPSKPTIAADGPVVITR
jgi:hypothetical protein